ncbi:MAG: O-antigen ligase family protein [Elainellaceae cyanobacterium]
MQLPLNLSKPALLLGLGGSLLGVAAGALVGEAPALIAVAFVVAGLLACLLVRFDYTVLGLFSLRSSLDLFADQQLPAAFAIGMDALTILYVSYLLLTRKKIQIDGFWLLFAIWLGLQGLWIVFIPLGGLGSSSAPLMSIAIREWIRVGSWLLAYLLIMQLKGRIPPETVIQTLFFALIVPLVTATMQLLLPPSMLPAVLVFDGGEIFEANSRISGSLGHANTFGTFVLFFIGLTFWQLQRSTFKVPWLGLLATLAFFLVSTKALGSLAMFATFIIVMIVPRLSLPKLIGGAIAITLVIVLFGSTEFGRERLGSLYATPLLNPHIDWSRAVLLSWFDSNSFNWRISQWAFLIDAWRDAPWLGYGLDTSSFLTVFTNYAHNDYVRALAETGVVGLFLFLSFIFAQFLRLVQLWILSKGNPSKQAICTAMLAFLAAMIVGMSTENIWTHTTLFFYWWVAFATVGWDWKRPQSIQPDSAPALSPHTAA